MIMLYAAMTFWLLILVFSAYGVYQLWAGMVQPQVINAVLLPGTLVAQLGRAIAVLITGGSVKDAGAAGSDAKSEPAAGVEAKPTTPGLGSFVVALLPILACGLTVHLVVMTVGHDVMGVPGDATLEMTLPASFDSPWELLRGAVTLVEQVTTTVRQSDFGQWQSWVFVYLIICLMVRMAPLPGTQRGAIGAILFLGVAVALIGMATQATADTMGGVWHMLSFSVGSLLFLLLVSLMVRGGVGLFKILTNQASA